VNPKVNCYNSTKIKVSRQE